MLIVLACFSLVGCEQLADYVPWLSKSESNHAAKPGSSSSNVAVPERPLITPQELVATVNGVPISKADMELRIQELKLMTENVGQSWTVLSSEELERLLDELINHELMRQDALAQGLAQSPNTQRRWEFVHRGFFAQEWLRQSQERLAISPDEIEGYYQQNKPGFREPEKVRLRQLVVNSEEQAKLALTQLYSGTVEFSSLAQRLSVGPTASQGGLLEGWVMRSDDKAFLYPVESDAVKAGVISLDPVLEASAFAVDRLGGVSSDVKGADGRFHIFQLVEKQAERHRPINEVWDDIKGFLLVQKLQQSLDDLHDKATIERFAERLEAVAQ